MRLCSQLLGCLAVQRIVLGKNHEGEHWEVAQLVDYLLSMHEALGSLLALPQVGVMAHTCHPSPWKFEVEGSQIQGHPST